MKNLVTVITGPPGTGKSQVVTNLIINCALQGKNVLFASKNNKAVDVVETRVNNLGSRPIVMRHGSGQYKTRLLEYIVALSTQNHLEDKQQYEKLSAHYQVYIDRISALNEELMNKFH